jgi:nitroimidazol reductase NimA-like FMN-containing flavoprotein (pyridoxamine 5'-phosphate oxidase superfamily)
MLIQDMTSQACIDLLSRTRLGRLACAEGGQPYITPLFFAYHPDALYGFSTVGQKINWMRANPLVCVQTDEVNTPEQWRSVIVLGRYEELTAEADYDGAREHVYNLLQQRPLWWDPGYAKTVHLGKERPLELVYFRIQIHRITGHYASD